MSSFSVDVGKSVSKKERQDKKILNNSNLVYGEITFEALHEIFLKISNTYGKPNSGYSDSNGILQEKGGTFCDLGSGIGKAVIAAAVLHNFDICIGIEYLEGLHSVSMKALEYYNTKGKAHPHLLSRSVQTECEMIRGDFLNIALCDWRKFDIVFANSTCYDDKLMEKIGLIAKGMRKGSFFISLTRRLPIPDFEVLDCKLYPMSWGEASIFLMQKINDPYTVLISSD